MKVRRLETYYQSEEMKKAVEKYWNGITEFIKSASIGDIDALVVEIEDDYGAKFTVQVFQGVIEVVRKNGMFTRTYSDNAEVFREHNAPLTSGISDEDKSLIVRGWREIHREIKKEIELREHIKSGFDPNAGLEDL